MNQQRFSEFAETQEQLIRVAGLIPDGAGGYENVITNDRYLPTELEFENKMGADDFDPFLTHIAQKVIDMGVIKENGFRDLASIINVIYSDIYPRIAAIEAKVGIPETGLPEHTITPRPEITWSVVSNDALTVLFSTTDLHVGDLAANRFSMDKTGIPYNPSVVANGVGYFQSTAQNVTTSYIRLWKTDLSGYRDNLSAALKDVLVNVWWTNTVPWMAN